MLLYFAFESQMKRNFYDFHWFVLFLRQVAWSDEYYAVFMPNQLNSVRVEHFCSRFRSNIHTKPRNLFWISHSMGILLYMVFQITIVHIVNNLSAFVITWFYKKREWIETLLALSLECKLHTSELQRAVVNGVDHQINSTWIVLLEWN